MAPYRRAEGLPPPDYDGHGEKFSVQVSYLGFFMGSGINRGYIGGEKAWYDGCHIESWDLSTVEGIIADIGISYEGIAGVYWSIPGYHMASYGYSAISSSEDTNKMCMDVIKGNQILYIYIEHYSRLQHQKYDDVLEFPMAPMPPVISPKKVAKEQEELREDANLLPPFENEWDYKSSDNDNNYDPEIEDSDYKLNDGDDDLFDDHIDELDDFKGKKQVEPVEDPEDDYLELPDSDDDEIRFNFRSFEVEDMRNPTFRVGQVFASVEMLRKAIREYSCRNRVDISMPTNDKKRLAAKCQEGCSWYLWASHDSRSKCFMIKRYNNEHQCPKKWNVRGFSYKFLAEKYIDNFRADENMNLKFFARIVQRDWNMKASRSKLGRARRLAMKTIYGDDDAQYNLLWDYAQELRTSNPGSKFYLTLDDKGRFSQCYFSFDAMKRGFLEGCRPVICLDGCHLKTKYGGILLTAVGMDPNDCIYPVAFAVVEVEDTDTWTWFLQTLKEDLGIHNTEVWTIMSDKQKGLIKAVRRSTTATKFDQAMEEMKALNHEAHDWLDELAPDIWVRAFQSDWTKCDILLNNNCEVFNRYILEARELPMLAMIERVKSQITTRVVNKQEEAEKWPGKICPKIAKKLDKYIELSANCHASNAGNGVFHVMSNDNDYIVELLNSSCSCRRWDLSGIPCHHAIACMREERIQPEDHVHPCYPIGTFRKAYAHNIRPCRDRSEWVKVPGCPNVDPPHYDKKVGRPAKNRRKQPEEKACKNGGTKMSKHGVVIHCSHCAKPGHNRAGCNECKSGLPPRKQRRSRIRALPYESSSSEEEPVITQVDNIPTFDTVEEPMVDVMSQQVPPPRVVNANPRPLPDSNFVETARRNTVPVGTSIPGAEANLAMKAQAMRQERIRAFEQKREDAFTAKYEEAQKKKSHMNRQQRRKKWRRRGLLLQRRKHKSKQQRSKNCTRKGLLLQRRKRKSKQQRSKNCTRKGLLLQRRKRRSKHQRNMN